MRLSVTTIEAFRQYRDGVTNYNGDPYVTQEKLIQRIKKEEEEPSVFMLRGTAFHKLMGNPKKYFKEPDYICSNIRFDKSIEKAFEYSYKDFPFEIKTVKPYIINSEKLNVVGVADPLVGNIAIENKTKWGSPSLTDYYDSVQWRFYLELFEAEMVQYQIFLMQEKKKIIYLKDFIPLQFTSYPNMSKELTTMLAEFLEFIKIHNLENYLKDK